MCGWLADQGLAEYAPNFRAHAMDGRELAATSDDTLENKLGVGKQNFNGSKTMPAIMNFVQCGKEFTRLCSGDWVHLLYWRDLLWACCRVELSEPEIWRN